MSAPDIELTISSALMDEQAYPHRWSFKSHRALLLMGTHFESHHRSKRQHKKKWTLRATVIQTVPINYFQRSSNSHVSYVIILLLYRKCCSRVNMLDMNKDWRNEEVCPFTMVLCKYIMLTFSGQISWD